jgi:DNA-binding LacI/PurR family transcriptional regulator
MSKRVTIKDVAERAGVSYQTVSKVLNKQAQVSAETEARIRQAVRVLGYHPDYRARNLRTQRSRMLGYSWAPFPPDQGNPIHEKFLQSMMDAAERAGYQVLPFPYRQPSEHIAAYHELIKTGRVDGFVLSSVEFDDPRLAFLLEQQFPFVAFGRSNPNWDFPYVDVDNTAGIQMVMQHLLGLGHRRIAALTWPESSRVGRDRLDGYVGALRDAGIPVRDEFIARVEGHVASGYGETVRWLGRAPGERPTAVVAFSDPMAIGAMRAVQERGLRVGADMAVTGFDDAPLVQYLTPALTSVRQPIWEVGQQIIATLTALLDGAPPPETHVLLEPRLIVRESSVGFNSGRVAVGGPGHRVNDGSL